ncbi:MAG: hypothetical protein ACRCZ9_09550 [Fusobacteriaceae bacterium]
MTNVELNNIHYQIFGVQGLHAIAPEPIDHCYAEQLVSRWVTYAFASGTEREVVMRYKSLGLNYALQKLFCKTSMAGYWSCKCGMPNPQFNQGNQVFVGEKTPFALHSGVGNNPLMSGHTRTNAELGNKSEWSWFKQIDNDGVEFLN